MKYLNLLLLGTSLVFLTGTSANASSVIFSPPSTLVLNGQNIETGKLNVTTAIAFYLNENNELIQEVILDPNQDSDNVSFEAIIGDQTPHFLFQVPNETQVLRYAGFFDAMSPDLSPAFFDITLDGIDKTNSSNLSSILFLPTNTNDTGFQLTTLGVGGSTVFNTQAPLVAIDNNGQIVVTSSGNALSSGGFTDHGVTRVPEPFTILGVSTAAGFGAFFKRKLAKKNEAEKA